MAIYRKYNNFFFIKFKFFFKNFFYFTSYLLNLNYKITFIYLNIRIFFFKIFLNFFSDPDIFLFFFKKKIILIPQKYSNKFFLNLKIFNRSFLNFFYNYDSFNWFYNILDLIFFNNLVKTNLTSLFLNKFSIQFNYLKGLLGLSLNFICLLKLKKKLRKKKKTYMYNLFFTSFTYIYTIFFYLNIVKSSINLKFKLPSLNFSYFFSLIKVSTFFGFFNLVNCHNFGLFYNLSSVIYIFFFIIKKFLLIISQKFNDIQYYFLSRLYFNRFFLFSFYFINNLYIWLFTDFFYKSIIWLNHSHLYLINKYWFITNE